MAKTDALFLRRKRRLRIDLREKSIGRPRLSVFRSSKHIYAQVIDDTKGVTLAAASSLDALEAKAKRAEGIQARHGRSLGGG